MIWYEARDPPGIRTRDVLGIDAKGSRLGGERERHRKARVVARRVAELSHGGRGRVSLSVTVVYGGGSARRKLLHT